MFIAHQCLILGADYFSVKSQIFDHQPITFVDFVPIFRNHAAKLLKTQLDTQQQTLTDFIQQIGGLIKRFSFLSMNSVIISFSLS